MRRHRVVPVSVSVVPIVGLATAPSSTTRDPDLDEVHMKFESPRTGDACAAEELAADDDD